MTEKHTRVHCRLKGRYCNVPPQKIRVQRGIKSDRRIVIAIRSTRDLDFDHRVVCFFSKHGYNIACGRKHFSVGRETPFALKGPPGILRSDRVSFQFYSLNRTSNLSNSDGNFRRTRAISKFLRVVTSVKRESRRNDHKPIDVPLARNFRVYVGRC